MVSPRAPLPQTLSIDIACEDNAIGACMGGDKAVQVELHKKCPNIPPAVLGEVNINCLFLQLHQHTYTVHLHLALRQAHTL